MFCKHCGAENPSNAEFCKECGQKLVHNSGEKKRHFVSGIIVAVVLVCVTGVVLLGGNRTDITDNPEDDTMSGEMSEQVSEMPTVSAIGSIADETNPIIEVKLTIGEGDETIGEAEVTLTGYDADQNEVWTKTKTVLLASEVDSAYALGQFEDKFFYSDVEGVYAVDTATGDELWSCETSNYIKEAVFGTDGTAYCCGFIDPVFCAISTDGEILKEISSFSGSEEYEEYPSIKGLTDDGLEIAVDNGAYYETYVVNLTDYSYYSVEDDSQEEDEFSDAVQIDTPSSEAETLSAYNKFLEDPESYAIDWGDESDEKDAFPFENSTFGLTFLDNDAQPELIVYNIDGDGWNHLSGYGVIFSYKNNQMKCLGILEDEYAFYEKTGVFYSMFSKQGVEDYSYYKVSDNEKKYVLYKCVDDFYDTGDPTYTYGIPLDGVQDEYGGIAYDEIDEKTFNNELEALVGNTKQTTPEMYDNTESNRKKVLQ